MIKFYELSDDKISKNKEILSYIVSTKNINNGLLLMMRTDDKEKIVYIEDHDITVYLLNENNGIELYEFIIDDNYDIKYAGFNGYTLVASDYTKNKEYAFINNKNNNEEQIYSIMNDSKDSKVIAYLQYNEEKHKSVLMTYTYPINDYDYIYNMHLKNPFQITFNKGIFKSSYIKTEFNINEPELYMIQKRKELKKSNDNRYFENSFFRYYKVIFRRKDKDYTTTFPFGKSNTLNDMKEKIKKEGFNDYVPDFLIKFYNGEISDYEEMLSIAQLAKEYNLISKNKILERK